MNRHIIIGLTGGIGSGKSAAARLFEKNGIPVLDADMISRNALDIGTDCYKKTVELFGEEALNPDGSINRKYVAALVFSNHGLREQLNGIIHPYVRYMLRSETEKMPFGFVVWEVPLLFESGTDRDCDVTVTVTCRESIRIRRIMERDQMTREQAKARINAQMTDRERKSKADFALRNEEGMDQLEKRVNALVHKLEDRYE